MPLNRERLEKMKLLARRDDCLDAPDGFVPSDIRELICDLEAAMEVVGQVTEIAVEFGEKLSTVGAQPETLTK